MTHEAAFSLFDVEGWVCVATGGGTGIGLMIAQALANNEAKGKHIPVTCDVTLKDSIKQLVQVINKQEDHIDLLVNNAGISEGKSDIEKGDQSAKWTNVIGCFFTTTAFLPLLKATSLSKSQHTGSVINITSAVLVRLNHIAPGIFPSEMTSRFDELNGSQIPVGED
ncbi:NAD(P)-binding protein [Suillus weaverae]|nr:NAD(P)-binding protein [Suillus weaverae]